MEYIAGIAIGIVVVAFSKVVGFDRDRSFYPTVLIVIASYYVLFAAIGQSMQVALAELIGMGVFLSLAIAGFKVNLWWAVFCLFAHGVYDFNHDHLIENPGMPLWWPAFCGSIDLVAAVGVGLLTRRRARH